MGRCRICGGFASSAIGYCRECLIKHWSMVREEVMMIHVEARSRYMLTPLTPRGPSGVKCGICGRGCIIPSGSRGYCSYVSNKDNALSTILGGFNIALGDYYYDPHPTNCVAYPVCPAVTGLGYPDYALTPSGERGYCNIAVFYGSCNMDCLYCQNQVFKTYAFRMKPFISIDDLVNTVNDKTTCVCFFGGDPAPNAVHALLAARLMVKKARETGLRVFRVCWETNGLWEKPLLREAVKLSLETGGIVKFDLKAYTPQVYSALTGVEEEHVEKIYDNIRHVIEEFNGLRSEPPLFVVSTLLVPGYVSVEEVEGIAGFIASLDPEIPLVLLGFHPDFYLSDLPPTSRRHALKALATARRAGLKRVYLGNEWLLSGAEYQV